MNGALDGIRVIDATNFVFGPVATQMLGDMGADVIKVEPPEGDPTRGIGASRSPGMGSLFLNLNRNKRSVVLDLKRPDDLAALRDLIAGADVFVHNMRQGAIARLGLGCAALRDANPRLVYAAAQGFGEGGRYFDRPAYDDVIQGLSGIAGLNARMTGAACCAAGATCPRSAGSAASTTTRATSTRSRSGSAPPGRATAAASGW